MALARNEIANSIEASISNADFGVTTTTGLLSISANERATIDAEAIAASVAAGFGGNAGIGLAGAGAESTNIVLASTNAFGKDSKLNSAGNLSVKAEMTGLVKARVVGVAVGAGVGGAAGVGVAIGASVGRNLIGYDLAGTRPSAVVQAYLKNTSIINGLDLIIEAKNNQTIEASVPAVAVAIAGGAEAAVGISGAGASMTNRLGVDVNAYIDGDGANGITVNSVSVKATDESTIDASAGATAVAASFGTVGVSASIGLSLASNSIQNDVAAYIKSASNLTARTGGVSVIADEKARITSVSYTASAAISVSIGGLWVER